MPSDPEKQHKIKLAGGGSGPVVCDPKTWDKAGEVARQRGTTRNALLCQVIAALAHSDPHRPLTIEFPPAPKIS